MSGPRLFESPPAVPLPPLALRRAGAADGLSAESVPDDCRRRTRRRHVLRNALIVFRGGHCTLRCVVCDVSETGARLKPADPGMCPDAFVLKLTDGPSRHCEVAWRKGGMVGVRFL